MARPGEKGIDGQNEGRLKAGRGSHQVRKGMYVLHCAQRERVAALKTRGLYLKVVILRRNEVLIIRGILFGVGKGCIFFVEVLPCSGVLWRGRVLLLV